MGSKIIPWLYVFSLSSLLTFSAAAQTVINWKTTEGWSVYYSPEGSLTTCATSRDFPGDDRLIISIAPKAANFSLVISNNRWKSLQHQRRYTLEIRFDGLVTSGNAVALNQDGYAGLGLGLNQKGLAVFAAANVMTVFYDGSEVVRLPLVGTGAAVRELENCQRAVNPAGWPGGGARSDPFRR